MKFTENEGSIDRMLRILLGSAALGFGLLVGNGTISIAAFIFGIALLETGIVGYCGLYSLCGISTVKKKDKKTKGQF